MHRAQAVRIRNPNPGRPVCLSVLRYGFMTLPTVWWISYARLPSSISQQAACDRSPVTFVVARSSPVDGLTTSSTDARPRSTRKPVVWRLGAQLLLTVLALLTHPAVVHPVGSSRRVSSQRLAANCTNHCHLALFFSSF
jgi:hypothetical protein